MLTTSKLTLGYGNKPVLHVDSLHLQKGEECLITGASGSGKTTLLYAIAGLLPVITGSIAVNETDITKLSESGRDHFRGRHIGIIFQTLHLIKSLSVMDNLLLASYIAGTPQKPEPIMQLLKTLNIADKKDAMPAALSHGQAQRVAIARAVLHRPALILADEPTSSLDDASCAAVIGLIKQAAHDTGAALLISTHDSRVKAHFKNVITLGKALEKAA